jgi:hypothetical protein
MGDISHIVVISGMVVDGGVMTVAASILTQPLVAIIFKE